MFVPVLTFFWAKDQAKDQVSEKPYYVKDR